MIFYALPAIVGYIIIIASVAILCLVCYFVRKQLKLGVYTKEEEAKMKSNLDLLLKEEKAEEGKDYRDEV